MPGVFLLYVFVSFSFGSGSRLSFILHHEQYTSVVVRHLLDASAT